MAFLHIASPLHPQTAETVVACAVDGTAPPAPIGVGIAREISPKFPAISLQSNPTFPPVDPTAEHTTT
jgi:hypothetical protein